MKGAILSVNPRARIVDITHEIPAHDIRAGAFTILAAHGTFPAGTINVCVVDPGVGSARRPILISTREYFFVGPDNGLFSYVCERAQDVRVFHLTNSDYFRQPLSATFHGRDLFAPVAAAISKGVEPGQLGEEVTDYVRLEPIGVRQKGEGMLEASVIHVDRFGNCVTSITRSDLTEEMLMKGARLKVRGREISSFRNYFAEDAGAQAELFAVWGSAGFLEIAVQQSSAARLLGMDRGEAVYILTR